MAIMNWLVMKMEVTEKQKNCPYCHSHQRYIIQRIGRFDVIDVFVDGNLLKIPEYYGGQYDGTDEEQIFYCPMCGRRLSDEIN